MSLKKLALTLAMAGLVSAGTAHANTILTFGQSSGSNTITGTQAAGTTTITGTNVGVVITQIDAAVVTPLAAFLNLTMTSVAPAVVTSGNVSQRYTGTFTITSGAGGSGTNYLSGNFTDSTFGAVGGAGLTVQAAQPPDTVSFTSGVISTLNVARNISLSLTNVTPFVNVTNSSIGSFTASIGGNFSANNVVVPEPATLMLLGTALAGLAIRRRRSA